MGKILDYVFEKRGYDTKFFEELDDYERKELLDVDILATRLYRIREEKSKIVVLPDFDMDGIMSGVIGFAGLSELGFSVDLFIPRPDIGYGFNEETIDILIEQHPDVKTILTCDNGITAFAGVEYANSKGINVLITDHHKPYATYPLADIVVNPLRHEDTYVLKGICGAHVLWQCLLYFAKTYGTRDDIIQIDRLQVFAGIGTISDTMPVIRENRQLVKNAIAICRLVLGPASENSVFMSSLNGSFPYVQAFRGLYNALYMFYDLGKIQSLDDLDEDFFGFYLAPIFNSLKRLEGDVGIAFRVFFDNKSVSYLQTLYSLSEKRKVLVTEYMDKILNADNKYAPYIYFTDAPSGLRGLLATKIMNMTGLPTFVVSENENGYGYKGSGRSPGYFMANSILSEQGFYISGHEGAFGCGFTDVKEIKALCTFLEKNLEDYMQDVLNVDIQDKYDYIIDTSGEIGFSVDIPDLIDFYYDYKRAKPFGRGFEKPLGCVKIVKDEFTSVDFTVMGSRKQHLKIDLPRGFQILLWNQANLLEELEEKDEILIEGYVGMSEFLGRNTVNFMGCVVK